MLIGSSASAASNVLYPSTSCRNWSDTKKKPNMAKNCRNNDADPVAKPRWENRRGSSSGSSVRSSIQMNPTRKTTPPIRPTSVNGSVQPRSGPSMIPRTSRPIPMADTTAPRGSRPTCSSDRVLGTTAITPMHDRAASPGGDEEDRAPPELLEQRARDEDAERAAGTGEAGPDADRLGAFFRREHAGDGGQGARHEERSAQAGERAQPDEGSGRAHERRQQRPDAEDGGAGDQRTAAPEPVAHRAGGEQQRGEHQCVRIDDPLLRRLAGVEAGRRCSASRWRASTRRRRPSPGPCTSRPGSSPDVRTRLR